MERTVQTVYDDGNVWVRIEVVDGRPFVHVEVETYNKSVYKQLKNVFQDVVDAMAFYGWDALYCYTANLKFTKIHPGGEVIGSFEYNGETLEVVKWELKQQ